MKKYIFFAFFFAKNLHMSKKSSTFAQNLKSKTFNILAIR